MLNIILINYNSTDDTINCVNSIIDSNSFMEIKIQIFDNNSEEQEKNKLEFFVNDKKQRLNEFTNDIEVFFSNENLGFAYGNNYFMKKANQDDYIWILNNDTLVNSALIEAISKNLPEIKEVLHFDCHTFNDEFHDSGLHYVNLLTGQSKMKKTNKFDFEYVCGASFIIQKTDSTPLFDESYFLYYEDCDYGMLLNQNGYNYKKLENVHFLHKIGGSGEKQKKKINLIQLRSQVLFMKRYSTNYFFYLCIKCIILVFRRYFIPLKKFVYYNKIIKIDSSLMDINYLSIFSVI